MLLFKVGSKIKKYQIIITTTGCLVFPFSWLAFEFGFAPESSYLIYFLVYTMLLFVRLVLLREMVKIPIMMFFRDVLVKVLPVMAIGFILPALVSFSLDAGWLRLILVCVVSTVSVAFSTYRIGLSVGERKFVLEKVKTIYLKLRK